MKIDQNPFSIYDFLGYLIPGVIFITGVCCLYNADFSKSRSIVDILIIISQSLTLSLKFEDYLLLLLLCYLLGHIISFLSSITIEQYSIWSIGYPSRYLLGRDIVPLWISKEHTETKSAGECNKKRLWRIIICPLIFPVWLIDLFTRKMAKMDKLNGKKLDKRLIEIINCSINNLIKLYPYQSVASSISDLECQKSIDHDFFRIIYHYALEHTCNHMSKMQNYVALYGFSRTMCFSFVLFSWMIFVKLFWFFSFNVFLLLIIATVLSFILYSIFNKFYRKFSLESFMAMLTAFRTKPIDNLCKTTN